MHHLRFRQIHLDFHTSEHIPGIGSRFDKAHWQETLKRAHVDSITCFATCHHGWAYYETEIGEKHPYMGGELLRQQFEACKEIDVNVPIYLTAGINNMAAVEYPEWRQISPEGRLTGWAGSNLEPGFFRMCFNTGYLDFLCKQIEEVVTLFPTCDGIFLDIISQPECACHRCIETMQDTGLDPLIPADRAKHSRHVLLEYYRRTTEAARINDPEMPIFHNSGHITPGDTEILQYFSHLELESLPTGGWGYDHFPSSAKYCANLPHDVMGMTGKFHTTWGEFGGFKHPNALRYECAAMLAVGAKCSVGDQLHPEAVLDESTYDIIGAAYGEVAAKEPWCDHVVPVADIGVIASTAIQASAGGFEQHESASDVGVSRIMLEGQFLYTMLDPSMDFSGCKAILLPDDVAVSEALKKKLDDYIADGGRLILSGESGPNAAGDGFLWDLGASCEGKSPVQPDYMLPAPALRPDFVQSPMVMYYPPYRTRVIRGRSLGVVHDSYFNRRYDHFCSHQHTPNLPVASDFACGVMHGPFLYFAHPVFSMYRAYGAVAYRHYITKTLQAFLEDDLTVTSNMPSTARLHLNHQPDENRYVLHLLYANTVLRGGRVDMHGGTVRDTRPIEVIEELMPLRDVEITANLQEKIQRVTLEPQGQELAFKTEGKRLTLNLDGFTCHQMVVLHH